MLHLIDLAGGVLRGVLRRIVDDGLGGAHLIADDQFLTVEVQGIRHGRSTVVVGICLVGVYSVLYRIQHLIDRIAEAVSHSVATYGIELAEGVAYYIVQLHDDGVHSERSGRISYLHHIHLRTGKIGLHHLGVVRVAQRNGVALGIGRPEGVRPLCSRVGQVDLRKRGERYTFVLVYLNTLGDIFERREQGGELACRRVRGDGNIAGQFPNTGRSMAPDRRGVRSEESVRSSIFGHLGLLAVEGEVDVVQTEGDGRHADIVLRQPEADRQGVVDRAAADTPYEIDKRRVEEVVLHFVGEIIGAGKGVPAAGYHGVSVQTCLDVVLADRHADGVFPLRVGLFHLAVGGHQLAVDIETDTLGRDVRAGIIDMSPHGEGADVLEVDIVRREGRRADEHGAFLGIEPVDA